MASKLTFDSKINIDEILTSQQSISINLFKFKDLLVSNIFNTKATFLLTLGTCSVHSEPWLYENITLNNRLVLSKNTHTV